MKKFRDDRKSLLMIVVSMLIWGSIGIFRKNIPLASSMLSCVRGLSGALFVLVFSLVTKKKMRSGKGARHVLLLVLTGAMIGFNWMLLFESYRYTSVATATLCYYMQPTIVILLSPLLFREKITLKKGLCAAASLFGMVLVSGIIGTGSSGNDLRGILYGLGAAALYSAVVILNKKNPSPAPYEKTVIQLASAGAVMIPYILFTGDYAVGITGMTGADIAMTAVLGLVHTGIAYALYFGSMDGLPAQTVAILSYIDPVSALLMSWAFLHEGMNAPELIGALIILGAAAVSEITFAKHKATPRG